jgi:hypothetical protein
MAALTASARTLTDRIKTCGSPASSAALLVTGRVAFRRGLAASGNYPFSVNKQAAP